MTNPPPFTIHAGLDPRSRQHVNPIAAVATYMTVGVEDFRRAMFCQCLFQCFNAGRGVHAVGEPRGQNLSAKSAIIATRYRNPRRDTQEALQNVRHAAQTVSNLKETIGRIEPDVIT